MAIEPVQINFEVLCVVFEQKGVSEFEMELVGHRRASCEVSNQPRSAALGRKVSERSWKL